MPPSETEAAGPQMSLAAKARHELQLYLTISAYLFVCFGAIILYKTAILRGQGVAFTPYGLAAIKALILGKFILIGHGLKLGERGDRGRVAVMVIRQSLRFLLLLVVLTGIEELIAGLIHHRGPEEIAEGFMGSSWLEATAVSLLMLLVLIPYFTFRELDAHLGEGRLMRLLLERHEDLDKPA